MATGRWCGLYASQTTHEPDATVMEQLVQSRPNKGPDVRLFDSRPSGKRECRGSATSGRENYDRLSPYVIHRSSRKATDEIENPGLCQHVEGNAEYGQEKHDEANGICRGGCRFRHRSPHRVSLALVQAKIRCSVTL